MEIDYLRGYLEQLALHQQQLEDPSLPPQATSGASSPRLLNQGARQSQAPCPDRPGMLRCLQACGLPWAGALLSEHECMPQVAAAPLATSQRPPAGPWHLQMAAGPQCWPRGRASSGTSRPPGISKRRAARQGEM
jgi:hypothetical protein